MARKIFVSYKHSDTNVQPINGGTTARAYVDELEDLLAEDGEIYKGEGDEDLSEFKDETIETHLKDKIYDSSVTLVLISPCMKGEDEDESEQWIPWEISYSLKEISRNDRTSQTNAVLAVVLPDAYGSYDYFLKDRECTSCQETYRIVNTSRLFQILRDNMFNVRNPEFSDCSHHESTKIYTGESSYITSVKWSAFVAGMESCIVRAEKIRDNIEDYNVVKTVK